jgi:ketosteroid isomerase-like protein
MTATESLGDLAAKVAALDARVQTLEDELAITRTVVEYGFAVDSGNAAATGALYTEETVFDVDGGFVMRGRDQVENMVNGAGHQALLPNCAHTIGPVVVRPDGDTAVAVGYSRIYHRQGDDFVLFRIGCNRWELERSPSGWLIAQRTTRVLGSEESQAVLASGLRPDAHG